jgi:hypothetical protein
MTHTEQSLAEIADTLRRCSIRFGNERQMQDDIETILSALYPGQAWREYLLPGGRIDFRLFSGVGIECKVDGSLSEVLRQIAGYCGQADIQGVLLVTSRPAHLRCPATLAGKPVRVLWVAGNL